MILEAIRIATKYMCPVFYLTDGYLAAGSEPWKLPDVSKLQEIKITSYSGNAENFLPYLRNETTLARPWVSPGTKDLEHRIGGIEKADRTGNVSYDPDNHQKMINLRREKISRIANDIPLATVLGPESGKLLVLSWGSSYGAVHGAMQQLEREGKKVSSCHLNYLNPFPKNLGEILKKFKHILIPELNMGQLLFLIRAEFPGVNAEGFNKVTGQPFKIQEIKKKAESLL
jgi:2-oxoglutarate ferredoxin oxidoreductase subunit alpha